MAGPAMVLDFLQDWDPVTLILAALALTVVVLVASFGMATAWRRWKDGKRRRANAAKGLAPAPATPPPPAATGTRFQARAIVAKLPKAPKLPKVAVPKLGRKKAP